MNQLFLGVRELTLLPLNRSTNWPILIKGCILDKYGKVFNNLNCVFFGQTFFSKFLYEKLVLEN
jgi:hypothetical protein